MNGGILITGATGFLGTQVALRLLRDTEHRLLALVRAPDRESAEARLARAWWDWPKLVEAVGGRIEALPGDVSLPHLGLDPQTWKRLAGSLTHVVHTAADLRLEGPLEELRRVNVQGTAHVLELARAAHRDHGLERLAHVSTAYVAGLRAGTVLEEPLSDEPGFANDYERTKHEGELLVQEAGRELPVSVFRPGMVVGDSRTGAIKTFNTLYAPLRLYLSGRLRLIPASAGLRVNLVPVDYVADAVACLSLAPEAAGRTFHLTAPAEMLPRVGELLEFVRRWVGEELALRLPRTACLPLPPGLLRRAASLAGAGLPLALLPYFQERRRFDRRNTDRLLGTYPLDWRTFLPHLLRYAVDRGFLHRAERTVHEQILYRLQSTRRPVVFHDLAGGRDARISAAEVRRQILQASTALKSLGIGKGDRVAVVGWNSVRYLVLDTAVGLAGAASVPLYYTSPVAEIEALLKDSGARLLFVGAAPLLATLAERVGHIPLVWFGRLPVPEALQARVMGWEAFLQQGHAAAEPSAPSTQAAAALQPPGAPVGLADLATLRYTSGTTGLPKGVVFTHAQLRWMAETVASLLPWRARIRAASYLSFLPMNHVVEGILGTYAPYYVPAPLDLYFLEDFHGLQQALRQVRPSIFFSVPRLYEKVWAGFTEKMVGRWFAAGEGIPRGLRRLLRPLMRALLLRRAGLDRCAQLIVGSAPCGEHLLESYRALGIEVHNAFGLTEAPLLTLNRLGANRIGTVGQPLPDTEVVIAPDGEVRVRGPQVAAGTFEAGTIRPLAGGWLATGDQGRLTPEGSLVLEGRRKELLITSYGKNIHPARVELLLKEIPGVHEALVVGEGRPFCGALLWIRDQWCSCRARRLDRAIEAANARLSHPERVKRWAVLADDLSIERGDLTGNLKLRRAAIVERRRTIVEALYGSGATEAPPETVFHLGEAG
jgi:long-chain acyl-CoA synthetase